MMVLRPIISLPLATLLLLAGCGGERELDRSQLEQMVGGELKETVPVSGTVFIRGEPTAKVNIYAYSKGGGREPVAQTRTGPDGTYCWSTYEACDGLPPGEYQLAFAHIPKEGKGNKVGEDLLEGKYQDPSKHDFTLTVKSGEPQTDVNYELE